MRMTSAILSFFFFTCMQHHKAVRWRFLCCTINSRLAGRKGEKADTSCEYQMTSGQRSERACHVTITCTLGI
uniref:Secreted protein n=1 Tax=Arundo donax TaxID=35708 RepID=A0A0A8YHU7_ARUDO